jgi:tRNA threonylcarbamoyladenosine biosynthesis protein TsaB
VTGLVLGIDTSGTVNVGLAENGGLLAARTVNNARAHVEQLMPLVRDCLTEAGRDLHDVELILVGMGPGPFTGLRVGIVTAEILAMALARPVLRICSLDVIAAQQVRSGTDLDEFVVATDSRRRELYWARYDGAGRRIGGPDVGPAADLPRLPTVGPGVELYPDQVLAAPGPRTLDPKALALLGPGLQPVGREPLYLRRADAAEPTRPKSVLLHRPQRARA